jgi:hypothetical protein
MADEIDRAGMTRISLRAVDALRIGGVHERAEC